MPEASSFIKESIVGFPKMTLTVKPGANLKSANTEKSQAIGKPYKLSIHSIANLPQGGIRLDIGKWSFTEPKSKLIWTKPFKKIAAISIANTSDIFKLKSFITTEGFRLGQKRRFTGRGIYIVRGKTILAKINGSAKSRENVLKLTKKLGGNFAYKGTGESFIGGILEFRKLDRRGKLPEKIFILNGGNFIGINRGIMKDNPAVQRFLNSNSSAFFAKQIKPISPQSR